MLSAWRGFYRYLGRDHGYANNPCVGLRAPKASPIGWRHAPRCRPRTPRLPHPPRNLPHFPRNIKDLTMPSDAKWPHMNWPGAEEFTKLLGDMKMPMMPNADVLMRATQRNMAALSAANRIALEGAQAVAKRHMEIMQQTMGELTQTLQAMAATQPSQEKAARQAELLKTAYERAVANTRELGDLIQRSNGEAMSALNQRVAEAIDEVKQLVQQTKPG